MSNSPASNVTLTALGTEKREDPKTKNLYWPWHGKAPNRVFKREAEKN